MILKKKKSLYPKFIILFVQVFLLFLSCTTVKHVSLQNGSPGSQEIVLPKTVVDFLDKNGWDMKSYQPSDVSDLSGFQRHVRYYLADAGVRDLWKLYYSSDLRIPWDTGNLKIGLFYSAAEDKIYTTGPFPKYEEGDILIEDLAILGIYHIPAALYIGTIDADANRIRFLYLKENLSKGFQQIDFYPVTEIKGKQLEEEKTLIQHMTYYKSGSVFRDIFLYKGFHAMLIDELHGNILKYGGITYRILMEREGAEMGNRHVMLIR